MVERDILNLANAPFWVVEISWTRNTWEEICVFRDKVEATKSCQELRNQTARAYGATNVYRVRETLLPANTVL